MDFYLSQTGNDNFDGRSIETAWATIAKVNNMKFSAGDRMLFEGGKTFIGQLTIGPHIKGTSSSKITISSYGAGRATIDGTTGHGICIDGCEYLAINNINVIGAGRKTGNAGGRGIFVSKSKYIDIDNVDTSGFQKAGIDLRGCSNCRVTHVHAHDNGFCGILAEDECSNIYIGYCRAINNPGDPTITDNHSGNGILISATDSMIEYCEAAENGWDQEVGPPNGPVGIWCYMSDNVTIQHCISHNNHSTSGDGGGFDFDGGTQNCLLQYCYSYDNKSSGFLFWEYGSKRGIKNNTVRYCISQNDGEGGFRLGTSGPGGIDNTFIYNNVVFNQHFPSIKYDGGEVENAYIYNNIFIIGKPKAIVETWEKATFAGNCYWATDGSFKIGDYTSFKDWVKGTGQETVDDNVVGMNANPLLNAMGRGAKLTGPTQLPELMAYMLSVQSPCRGAGLDLKKLFGIDAGKQDFFGNAIPGDIKNIGFYR